MADHLFLLQRGKYSTPVFTCVYTFTDFTQTIQKPTPIRDLFKKSKNEEAESSDQSVEDDTEKPAPLRSLFVYRVLIGAFNYTALSLVDMTYRAVQPLFFSTPVEVNNFIPSHSRCQY
jgi:hypothetical protein